MIQEPHENTILVKNQTICLENRKYWLLSSLNPIRQRLYSSEKMKNKLPSPNFFTYRKTEIAKSIILFNRYFTYPNTHYFEKSDPTTASAVYWSAHQSRHTTTESIKRVRRTCDKKTK